MCRVYFFFTTSVFASDLQCGIALESALKQLVNKYIQNIFLAFFFAGKILIYIFAACLNPLMTLSIS
jgi:hypothetical protein